MTVTSGRKFHVPHTRGDEALSLARMLLTLLSGRVCRCRWGRVTNQWARIAGEPRKMVLRQPTPHVLRQQKQLIRIILFKSVITHKPASYHALAVLYTVKRQAPSRQEFFINVTTILPVSCHVRDHARSFSVSRGQCGDRILGANRTEWARPLHDSGQNVLYWRVR